MKILIIYTRAFENQVLEKLGPVLEKKTEVSKYCMDSTANVD